MAKSMKDLQQAAREMSMKLPLMENRVKGAIETIENIDVTINDFGFMDDNGKAYAGFTVKETPDFFYFGGKVLTEGLQKFESEGFGDTIRKEGLPVRFTRKKTQDGKREYVVVEYFPVPF